MNFIRNMKYKKCIKEYEKWHEIDNTMWDMVKKYTAESNHEMASLYLKLHNITMDKKISYLNESKKF